MLPHSPLFHKTNFTAARRIFDEYSEGTMTIFQSRFEDNPDIPEIYFTKLQQILYKKRFQG
jgi:hypothetical protein